MKRTAKLAIVLSVILLFSVGIGLKYASAQSIGYIDVTRVFKEYKETQSAQEELAKKEEKFKEEFEKRQKKLAKAEEDGKSKEEMEKMTKDLEEELEPLRTELLQLNEVLTTRLQKDILNSVEKVAKKVGIDIVLDKQVLIIGGVDLTDMVINELNK